MHTVCLVITYDGTSFLGWQKTKTGPTIEEALKRALERLVQEKITLQAASRTDRGVHAAQQVVTFTTSKQPPTLISLNSLLPDSIRVLEIKIVSPSFHPSLDAKGKLYTYSLCLGPIQLPFFRNYSWHVPYMLDIKAMEQAAQHLIGEHDFSAFCNQHANLSTKDKSRSIVQITFTKMPSNRLTIEIKGDHFLYKMVRTMVGTLVYVGRKKLSEKEVFEILASKERRRAGITAPAHGLTLSKIFY